MSRGRALLLIEHAGPLTTVQDAGRPGYGRFGVTGAGPMDRFAHAAANVALGRPPGGAAIETALGGIIVTLVEGALAVAVTGGAPQVTLDGKAERPWSVLNLKAGSRLQVRPGRWGSWTYLALSGVLTAAMWLDSLSTHAQTGLGGRRLQSGDQLEIVDLDESAVRNRDLPLPVTARPRQEIRVVIGPQDRFFSEASRRDFLNGLYVVSTDYDRMGMRLSGPKLTIVSRLDMLSEAIVRGSVQVPGHGDPIVLLADHQTTGGYPKIATVISADQDGLAQLRPHEALSFRAVTAEQAVAAARIRDRQIRAYLAGVGAGRQAVAG